MNNQDNSDEEGVEGKRSFPSGVKGKRSFPLAFENLLAGHAIACAVHFASAGILLGILPTVNLPIVANVPGPSNGTVTSTVTEHKTLAAFNAGIWIWVFGLLAALQHFYTILNRSTYRRLVQDVHANHWRWIEYAFSASAKNVVLAQLCRVTDPHVLFLLAVITASTMLHGYLAEWVAAAGDSAEAVTATTASQSGKRPKSTRSKGLLPFYLGTILYMGYWLVIICFYTIAVRKSTNAVPSFVHVIFATQLLLDSSFAANTWFYLQRLYVKSFIAYERNFVVLSLVSKVSLSWILYGGLARGNYVSPLTPSF